MAANRNPWTGYRMGLSPPPNRGVEMSRFQVAATRLNIGEHVNMTTCERTHWRCEVMRWAMDNRAAFANCPNYQTQMEHRICAVIERSDHHCGDDLVSMVKTARVPDTVNKFNTILSQQQKDSVRFKGKLAQNFNLPYLEYNLHNKCIEHAFNFRMKYGLQT